MTDQPKTTDQAPDLDAALAPLRETWGNTLDAFRKTWDAMKPLVALVVQSAETRAAAQEAIGHAYDEEDEHLAETLDGLNVEQLRDIATAATLLAEQAFARHAALTTIPQETETR